MPAPGGGERAGTGELRRPIRPSGTGHVTGPLGTVSRGPKRIRNRSDPERHPEHAPVLFPDHRIGDTGDRPTIPADEPMIDDRLRPTDRSTQPEPLSRDEVYYLLSNRRRRAVLSYLFEERSAEFSELVDHVVDEESAGEMGAERSDRRSAVYASLYQTHIPELVDADVVVHDADDNRVSITDTGRRLCPYLHAAPPGVPRWEVAFLAQAVGWIAVTAGVWSLGVVPVRWLLVGCAVAFLCTSVGYYWWIRRRHAPR